MKLNDAIPGTSKGHIFQINLSEGGVPKIAQPQAELRYLGLEGDHHRDLEHHGGAERALCLYSLEKILALQAEGHPIYPGAIGENLTIAGLDWSRVEPGVTLRFGGGVLVEITRYTTPCSNIDAAFSAGMIERVSQKVYPGWSRVYARVITPGTLQIGAPVEIASHG